MVCRGSVKNGVVVLEDGVQLPEGTLVRVEEIESAQAAQDERPGAESAFLYGRKAVHTGLPDLATNHDHYLYGHPKVRE